MTDLALQGAPTRHPGAAVVPDAPPCLLLNPRSFRLGRGHLADRIRRLARTRGLKLVEADGPAAFTDALREALSLRPRLLAVAGGDGTVQATINHLARQSALYDDAQCVQLPPLLLLAGGRTNLTARDLGHGSLLTRLERALDHATDELPVTQRYSLQLRQPGNLEEYGFFVAGALVDAVIRDCHRHQQSGPGLLRAGILGSPWRLLQLLLLASLGRAQFPPQQADVQAQGLGQLRGPLRILIATTLSHQRGLLNPYAEHGDGPLRLTAVLASAPGFWPRLPLLLRGRFPQQPAAGTGLLSGRCQGVTIKGLSGITLDGQEFDLDPSQPLLLGSGPAFRFLAP